MEVWHRTMFSKHDEVDHHLDNLAIEYSKSQLPGGHYVLTFEIGESDQRWPQVAELIRENKATDLYNTTFTPEEIRAAEWVRVLPTFEQGYPQPQKSWNRITYVNACPECGAGYQQMAPFYLAKEPNLGRHSFMSLYWTYTLFTTSDVFKVLMTEGIRGYEQWNSLIYNTGQLSQVVSQLYAPVVAKPGLSESNELQREVCPECGIAKCAYHKRGYMRFARAALLTDVDILSTHEWFGSGRTAFREILLSNRLACLILDHLWQGVSLKPLELI